MAARLDEGGDEGRLAGAGVDGGKVAERREGEMKDVEGERMAPN